MVYGTMIACGGSRWH